MKERGVAGPLDVIGNAADSAILLAKQSCD